MHEPIQLIYGLHNMYLYIRPEQGHHSKTLGIVSYDNYATVPALEADFFHKKTLHPEFACIQLFKFIIYPHFHGYIE